MAEEHPENGASGRRGKPRLSPTVVGLGFVALFGLGLVISQWVNASGPPITWVYDLQTAMERARTSGKRVFLYLYNPGCPITAEHDRTLFEERFVRERLARMVPCRLELKAGDPLRAKYRVRDAPVMVVLDPSGEQRGERVEGEVSVDRFRTYIKAREPTD